MIQATHRRSICQQLTPPFFLPVGAVHITCQEGGTFYARPGFPQKRFPTVKQQTKKKEVSAHEKENTIFRPAPSTDPGIERFAFYERAKKAYAIVATGESALYANIILKKGVVKDA